MDYVTNMRSSYLDNAQKWNALTAIPSSVLRFRIPSVSDVGTVIIVEIFLVFITIESCQKQEEIKLL